MKDQEPFTTNLQKSLKRKWLWGFRGKLRAVSVRTGIRISAEVSSEKADLASLQENDRGTVSLLLKRRRRSI